jgi:hypothetical protein
VHPSHRADAWDASSGAQDYCPPDLLTQDRIGTANIVCAWRGNRGGFHAQAASVHYRGCLLQDPVLGGAPVLEADIEMLEVQFQPNYLWNKYTQRLLEQLFPGLVAVHDNNRTSV